MTVGTLTEAHAWGWLSHELDRFIRLYGWVLTTPEHEALTRGHAAAVSAADRISDAATAAGASPGFRPPVAAPAAIGSPGTDEALSTPLGAASTAAAAAHVECHPGDPST